MKEEIRLFVAATLPEKAKDFLQEQAQVFNHPSLRFLPAQNLHLTLFFIGNTAAENMPVITDTLQKLSKEHSAFKLQYLLTEPGPNTKSPRLVWARFAQHSEFEKLSRSLAKALSPEQNAKRKLIPHVTLARYKKGAPAPPAVPLHPSETSTSLVVNAVSLWQSTLASPHPVYSVLETYPLTTEP